MKAAVEFQNVNKTFRNQKAVDNLTLSIDSGSVTALLGPNGAGKSTSVSMMLGLLKPTSGEVRLLGSDPSVPKNRIHIGAMLQQVELPQQVTVIQLIDLFRSYYPHPLPVKTLLEIAGLEHDTKRSAAKLSGGQKRRLQFALAMAGDPRVLFLDEPTTAMDVASRRAFWDSLHHFARQEGRTIIFTTHHLDEADNMADRVVLMKQGRCIADGTPTQIKRMAGYRYVSMQIGRTPPELIRSLPGIDGGDGVEISGGRARIRTNESDEVLRAIFEQRLDVHDIEVTSGALEDAFVSLTSDTNSPIENEVSVR